MRTLLRKWLGVTDLDARTLDVERHFITRRNPETGQVLETLADVPLGKREERKVKLGGMTWEQRKRFYEATDGGRLVNRG